MNMDETRAWDNLRKRYPTGHPSMPVDWTAIRVGFHEGFAAACTERDRLAATITRIRELADNYRDRDQMYLLSFLAKELDAALNDTDPPVAYAALDDNQDTP